MVRRVNCEVGREGGVRCERECWHDDLSGLCWGLTRLVIQVPRVCLLWTMYMSYAIYSEAHSLPEVALETS